MSLTKFATTWLRVCDPKFCHKSLKKYSVATRSTTEDPRIHPTAVIMSNVKLGPDSIIGPNTVIGENVIIGHNCLIGSNVSLFNCILGNHCILHPGVRIGQDGFGFYYDPVTNTILKKPQLKLVLIHDHVEIGANSCIDRGSWRDTVIQSHVKIDNLVQIAHNVHIGSHTMLCGQVGVAGSASIGSRVRIGGKAGIKDHVVIGDDVDIAASAMVTKNISKKSIVAGFPAEPVNIWKRKWIALSNLVKDSHPKIKG